MNLNSDSIIRQYHLHIKTGASTPLVLEHPDVVGDEPATKKLKVHNNTIDAEGCC